MREKLVALSAELTRLQEQMQDPSVLADRKEMIRIGRRLKEIQRAPELLAEWDRTQSALTVAPEVAKDPELKALAEEEAKAARQAMPELEKRIREFLLPKDPLDERSVILEVRAGTGGEEAALFAAELLRMYIRFAELQGWTTEIIDSSDAGAGGLKEASCRIEGSGVYGMLKFESGVHRVQRIPATEAKGRIHTSTATIAILSEAEEVDIVIRNEDLRIDTYRSGGAGGQHVNKTESAIRITHLPTGVVVACQTERSQIKNRALAMSLLRSRLYAAQEEKLAKERGEQRAGQVGTADRSEKIRTYNFPQDRLTDHRLNENFGNLPAIMEGDIRKIVDRLREWDIGDRLRTLH